MPEAAKLAERLVRRPPGRLVSAEEEASEQRAKLLEAKRRKVGSLAGALDEGKTAVAVVGKECCVTEAEVLEARAAIRGAICQTPSSQGCTAWPRSRKRSRKPPGERQAGLRHGSIAQSLKNSSLHVGGREPRSSGRTRPKMLMDQRGGSRRLARRRQQHHGTGPRSSA